MALNLRSTFQSPYEQYASRVGQAFTLLRKITTADSEHDAEVLPMYVIQFDDGTEIEAWPEEIFYMLADEDPSGRRVIATHQG